ncbi:MAG: DUF4843 domain-containing protein [Prevotella sp.]|jgi:hypothetical protein|nr:DUF4843 domain-containing protein [Prevotella sp.]
MKTKYDKILWLPLIILFIGACEVNKMEEYENVPAIYFANETNGQQDSLSYSFFILDTLIKRDTIHIKVCTMGLPTDHVRPIKLAQINTPDSNAAVPGVDYVPFDDPEIKDSMIIPSGAVSAEIPVILLRNKDLALSEKSLEIEVESNDYFRQGIDAWRIFTVKMSDMANKPKLWDTFWKYYFGLSWNSVKMRFIMQATGYTEWDQRPSDYSFLNWLSATAKQALVEYNQQHPDNPLRAANGDIVSMDN